MFQFHLGHIASLPHEGIKLTKSDLYNQAYIYENFIGIQFHHKIDLKFAKCEYAAIKNCPISKYCEIEFFKNYNKEHKPELIFKNFLLTKYF